MRIPKTKAGRTQDPRPAARRSGRLRTDVVRRPRALGRVGEPALRRTRGGRADPDRDRDRRARPPPDRAPEAGRDRSADGPRQPRRLPPRAPPGDPRAKERQHPGLAGAPRPRRLQAPERHPRASIWRRGPARRRAKLREAVRDTDTAARVGGEEFALVLPQDLTRRGGRDRRPRPQRPGPRRADRGQALELGRDRHLPRRRRGREHALRARRRCALRSEARGQAPDEAVRPPPGPPHLQGREALGADRADRDARDAAHGVPAGRVARHGPGCRVRGPDPDRHRARAPRRHAVRRGERMRPRAGARGGGDPRRHSSRSAGRPEPTWRST